MTLVQTCVIEPNVFFREGLKSLLAETDYQIVAACADNISDEMKHAGCDAALFIIGTDDPAADITELVENTKTTFPESKIVILTDRSDAGSVSAAFSAGVDGYLLRDISPQVLKVSLDMAMAGEKVCPSAIVSFFVNGAHERNDVPIEGAHHNLSSREVQVLQYLAEGGSNKQIARDLDITEATVKVHIKAVLRKLDLSNRTQAAVWAVNKGLTAGQQAGCAS